MVKIKEQKVLSWKNKIRARLPQWTALCLCHEKYMALELMKTLAIECSMVQQKPPDDVASCKDGFYCLVRLKSRISKHRGLFMSHSDTSLWKHVVETLCMWWCSLPHCVMCSGHRQHESWDREHWKAQPAVKLPLEGRKSLHFRKSFSLESLLFPVASGAGTKIF